VLLDNLPTMGNGGVPHSGVPRWYTALVTVTGLAAFAGVGAACSSEGAGATSSRELHREIEAVCADEVDTRSGDGAAAAPEAFLEAGTDGDGEAAIEAVAYNVEALERLADEVSELEAADETDGEALDSAVEAIEARRATWVQRQEILASGDVVLDGEEALIDLVQEGADTAGAWAEALEHFEIDEGDCASAVP
jgi:hypothetical protein